MAERREVISAAVPQVQYLAQSSASPQTARALYSIGDMMSRMNQRVQDRLDEQAAVEATAAGGQAGREGVPARQDDTTIRGRYFNRAAQDSMLLRFDMEARERVREYEDANQASPDKFKQASENYLQGAVGQLEGFDPGLALEFESNYRQRQDAALARVKERHIGVVRDRQLETALRAQLSLQDEMAEQASRLFSAGPEETQQVLAGMMRSASALANAGSQVGPDGMPLFSARERVALERSASDAVAEQVGLAWMQRQPDMLTAVSAWRKGEASIELADDTGQKATLPLRDLLGEKGYRTAEKTFMGQLKSQLALENQIDRAQDRAFKDRSDSVFTDLTVLAQDGRLTMNVVEASRASLEPDRYTQLRALAKGGGAAVSDGGVIARLTVDDADGKDVRAEATTAYESGQLATEDYLKIFNRNTDRLGEGMRQPVNAGRDFVVNSLGKLSSELGFAQAVNIAPAEAEYEVRISEFVQQNQRQPSTAEALTIGREVTERYAAIDTDTLISSLPKPRFMSASEKMGRSLNSQKVQEIRKKTSEYFLKKHGGNREAMNSDPEYRREVRTLRKMYDVLQAKEQGLIREVRDGGNQ